MQYWQIAPGDGNVDMVDIFFKLKVALIGPGREGDYFDNKSKYDKMENDGPFVRRFAEEVQIGDIFVLKRIIHPQNKIWRVFAVGEVAGPYRYEPIFDKVDCYEWDVQHCRRVLWRIPKKELTVQYGGAPNRLQRLDVDNPLRKEADKVLKGKVEFMES